MQTQQTVDDLIEISRDIERVIAKIQLMVPEAGETELRSLLGEMTFRETHDSDVERENRRLILVRAKALIEEHATRS